MTVTGRMVTRRKIRSAYAGAGGRVSLGRVIVEGFIDFDYEITQLTVRARAAEFLGLVGAAHPEEVLKDVLLKSESAVEANLILNTAVLLQEPL